MVVNSTPTTQGARTISYRPITDESNLVYLDWITAKSSPRRTIKRRSRRLHHVPDMGANGIREFIKYFYPQFDKEGM
jgi:tricorn protease